MSILALQALSRFEVPGAEDDLFVPVPLAFHIVLRADGAVLGVEPYDTTKSRKTVMTTRVRGRTSGISANFLVDQSEYVAGIYNGPIGKQDPKPRENRRLEKFAAFKVKWSEFTSRAHVLGIASPGFDAVTAFFDKHDPNKPDPKLTRALVGRTDLKAAGGDLTFFFGDNLIVETDEARRVLLELALQDLSPGDGTCMVTGRYGPVALGYDGIKGVPNTQSSGAALVSFNFEAALPYGLEGNLTGGRAPSKRPTYDHATKRVVMGSASVAPVSVVEMRRQTQALNHMLGAGAQRHRFRVGNSVYLAWGNPYAEKEVGEVLGWQAEKADPAADEDGGGKRKLSSDELRENVWIAMDAFNTPRSGEVHTRMPDIHLLGLTGAMGRVSITHWQQDKAAAMQARIALWVDHLAWGAGCPWGAATAFGPPWRPTLKSFERLLVPVAAGSKPTDATNAARGRVGEQLVMSAFAGQPIPVELQRIAVHLLAIGEFPGGSGNSSRLSLCALLGAAILRRTSMSKEDVLTQQLYVLGQAFALVEYLQKQIAHKQQNDAPSALRKLQTFVAGAPRKGYDRVMEAFNIARVNRALHDIDREFADGRMRSILDGLKPEAFPNRAEDSNLFYLGYHHEESRLWAMTQARIEASKVRKAAQAAAGQPVAEVPPPAAADAPDTAPAAVVAATPAKSASKLRRAALSR